MLLRPDVVDASGVERRIAEADAIRREILAGRLTFEDAARRHSAGPSRHRGGDLGWINRDGPMIEDFSKPVFKLSKGEVSKPVVTSFGVHLVKVTDVQPGRMGLDAVRPRLEKALAAKFVRDLVAAARERVPVTYVPGVPHFDPAAPVDDGRISDDVAHMWAVYGRQRPRRRGFPALSSGDRPATVSRPVSVGRTE